MMRRAALLQCFRSTNKTPKSEALRFRTVTAASKPFRFSTDRFVPNKPGTISFHSRHFCTNSALLPPPPPLNFTVTRSRPELVGPAEPTPRELKQLSNLDDQEGLRFLAPMVQFYRCDPSMKGRDPAAVIRDALARALVLYHPIAGRLVEARGRKLYVDCTGEGVWFVEADADVELAQLGDPPVLPFPWIDHVFPNDLPSEKIINSPLFFIQVTRLKCGGFILAFQVNHIISDAAGITQFLAAVGEIAQGAHVPSVAPIWSRELFSSAPHPHPVMCINDQDEKVEQPTPIVSCNAPDLVFRSLFFGPSKLSAIRRLVPNQLRHDCTTFEILTACLWRCRTIALQLDPEDVVLLMCLVNARDKTNQVVPVGYYGNTFTGSVMATTTKELCESPIEYAIRFVKKVKEQGTKECMSWRTNPPVINEHHSPLKNFLVVTDIRRVGFGDVDFGWGKPTYAGVAKLLLDNFMVYAPLTEHNGEDGILVSLCLEAKAMKRFEVELNNMLSQD